MQQLRACPFCGGKAEVAFGAYDYNVYQVVCESEVCSGAAGWADTPEEAIAAWNARKEPDYPRMHPVAKVYETKIAQEVAAAIKEALKNDEREPVGPASGQTTSPFMDIVKGFCNDWASKPTVILCELCGSLSHYDPYFKRYVCSGCGHSQE